MKAVTQEKIVKIQAALTKDNLVFIRVAGSPREYAIAGCRSLAHNIEFRLDVSQTLHVAPEELGVVRIVEFKNA